MRSSTNRRATPLSTTARTPHIGLSSRRRSLARAICARSGGVAHRVAAEGFPVGFPNEAPEAQAADTLRRQSAPSSRGATACRPTTTQRHEGIQERNAALRDARRAAHPVELAATVIDLDQQMRAFVRPLHGEILVIKSDNHPSYKAKSTREYMVESEMSPQFSPDYAHQGAAPSPEGAAAAA